MARNEVRIREGDRLWPLLEMISNTYIDDLTEDRIEELVDMVDSWRITDADGKRLPPRRARP